MPHVYDKFTPKHTATVGTVMPDKKTVSQCSID